MNLNYVENFEYENSQQYKPIQQGGSSIDSLLDELQEALNTNFEAYSIYCALKNEILREITLKDLAITKIMPDVLQVYETSPKMAKILMVLIALLYASYSEIGFHCGVTKQRVLIVLKLLREKYYWIDALLGMKNKNYENNFQLQIKNLKQEENQFENQNLF